MHKIAQENTDQIPLFFIVGRPRSGTTLLRTLFDAHPNVAIPLECKFALDLYPRYGKIRNWSQKDLDSFYRDLQKQLLFDTWTIDLDKLKAELDTCLGNVDYAHVCRLVYLNYKSFFEKDDILLIGDKNPGYTIYTKQLSTIFPGARFIHIIRDHRDNYLSLKNVDFELPIPSLAATKWKLFYQKFNKDAARQPENYLVLRYEALVSDPVNKMKELCRFLNLPYTGKVFDFDEKKEDVLKAYPDGFIERYHTNLLNKVNASRVGLYKEKLTKREIKLLDYAVGISAEEAGYERHYIFVKYWMMLQAFPGILLAHFLALLTRIVDRMPYRLRINILNKWPLAVARVYHRFKKG
jgi:hypothetical protein